MKATLKWLLLVALSVGLVLSIGCSWAPDEDEEEDNGPGINYEEPPETSDPGSLSEGEQEEVGEETAGNYTENISNITTVASSVGSGNFDFGGSGLFSFGDVGMEDIKLPKSIDLAKPDSFELVESMPQNLLNAIANYDEELDGLEFTGYYVPNMLTGDWYRTSTTDPYTSTDINIYVRFVEDIWESESTPVEVLTHAEVVVHISSRLGPVLLMYDLDRDSGSDMTVDGQMVRYASFRLATILFQEIGVTQFSDIPVEEGICGGTYYMQNFDTFIGEDDQLFQVYSTTELTLNEDCTGDAWVDVGIFEDFVHIVFETPTSGYFTLGTDGHQEQHPFSFE